MNFIERIFGWSPDAGTGSAEFLLFAVPIVALIGLGLLARSRR